MTTKPAGNGLGLEIVKKIVEAHGGKLEIESSAIANTIISVLFFSYKLKLRDAHLQDDAL